jgi:hypothetical protein
MDTTLLIYCVISFIGTVLHGFYTEYFKYDKATLTILEIIQIFVCGFMGPVIFPIMLFFWIINRDFWNKEVFKKGEE